MNKRTVRIVQRLSHSSSSCSLSSLASLFDVSERTIRNDLKSLNAFLEENSLERISLGPKGVIQLPENFSKAEEILPVDDTFAYKMSSEERKDLGAALLIDSDKYLTLNEIAELFSVSRATILNDLDGIKSRIADAGLQVESKPSRGLRVNGRESTKRVFLRSFISRAVPVVEQWLSMPEHSSVKLYAITIKKILNELCHTHGINLMDDPFQLAVNHLCICVERDIRGDFLEGLSEDIEAPVTEFDQETIALVGQYCKVSMGENEERFFAALRYSLRFHGGARFSIDDMQVQKLSRTFIRKISKDIGIDLNDDYDLFEYLSNHLESMFSTEPSHFPETPSVSEVINDQPDIFHAVERNISPLEDYADREISHVERMYIAHHICAALERRKNRGVRPRVVVVCNGGIGTSQLLAEELRGHFDIEVIKVVPAHDVPYLGSYNADLVISTVPVENCPVDHIVIKLPLREHEYGLIHEKLSALESKMLSTGEELDTVNAKGLLNRIEPIIVKHAGNDQALLGEIRVEVRRYFREAQHLETQVIAPYLHQLLPASHISLDIECSDWQDAIRKSAEKLLDLGYIEERYIDAMIQGVKEYGPYSVLAPGFAMPHASPDGGTIKMGMSLIRLREPVLFGSEANDPIEFVCTLSAVDSRTHLKALANLFDMITMPGNLFLKELRQVDTPVAAASLIEHYEYEVTKR